MNIVIDNMCESLEKVSLSSRIHNILMLHGSMSNKETMEKISHVLIRKGVKRGFNFFFLEAPFDFPNQAGKKMWYKTNMDDYDMQTITKEEFSDDFLETSKYVCDFIEKNQINVIVGFSQGAHITDSIITYCNTSIQKIVMISGFSFNDDSRCMNDNIHALNIVGEYDRIVPPHFAPSKYKNLQTLKHSNPKGHVMPSTSIMTKICDFIES